MTDEQLAELATALRARADWLDLPRNVEAPRPYISREQFRKAADALDRLRATVADRAAVEWQPIETAPKDCEAILGYQATEGDHEGRVAIVWHNMIWKCADYPGLMPTHWLPLPATPPQEKDHG